MTNAPIQRYGGKSNPTMRGRLLRMLPEHDCYCEVCGGSGAILFGKPKCKNEVFNDVDYGLVNLYIQIRDNFEKLSHILNLMPYGRGIYEEARSTWEDEQDPVMRAAKWFIVARQSFAAIGTSFGVRGATGNQGVWSYLQAIEDLPVFHERLREVCIENQDFRPILKRYNDPNWLLYVDPPYPLSTRACRGYEYEMTEDDHRELIEILLKHRGMIILSGYDTPLYRPLDDAGWDHITIETTCSAAGRVKGEGAVKQKQVRIEHVWRNRLAMENTGSTDWLSNWKDDE